MAAMPPQSDQERIGPSKLERTARLHAQLNAQGLVDDGAAVRDEDVSRRGASQRVRHKVAMVVEHEQTILRPAVMPIKPLVIGEEDLEGQRLIGIDFPRW